MIIFDLRDYDNDHHSDCDRDRNCNRNTFMTTATAIKYVFNC